MLHIIVMRARMRTLPNFGDAVRNKSKDAKSQAIIRLMKEHYKTFGPLLETSKVKAKRIKINAEKISASSLNLAKVKKNISGDSELSWTISCANTESLKLIKISSNSDATQTVIHKNPKFKFVPMKLVNTAINNSGDTLNEIQIKNNIANILPNEIIQPNKLPNEIKHKKIAGLKLNCEIKDFPFINDAKNNIDNWDNSEIISLRPDNQPDFSLPGVTRILNETMSDESKLVLENWKKRMILQLGEKEFELYLQKLKDDSTAMHSLIENTLKKQPIIIPEHLEKTYNSVNPILKNVTDVRLIESHVVHRTLGYRGFIDCVAAYKGNVCVIDWKKSDKIKTLNSTYDSPLQVSAYIGALNGDPNYSFQVKRGLLAIAYTRGQPASVFELSADRLEFYWKEWLKRLEKYYATRFS